MTWDRNQSSGSGVSLYIKQMGRGGSTYAALSIREPCRALGRGAVPQGKAKFIVTHAPRRPITPRRLLRLTDQRAIIETPAERTLGIVRERCPDLDLSLALKPAALPAPKAKPAPTTQPKRRRGS